MFVLSWLKRSLNNIAAFRPSLAVGIVIYGLGDLANRSLASLLLIPLYTHYLSVEDYGIITTLTPLAWLLITVSSTNMPGALIRFYHDDTDVLYRKRVCSTVVAYLIVAPLLVSAAFYFAGPYIFHYLLPNIPFSPYGVIMLGFVYFSLIPQTLLALWRTEEKPIHFALFSCSGFLVTTAGIAFMVAYRGEGVYGKMLAELVVAAGMAALSFVLMRRQLTWRLDIRLLQGLLLFSAPMVPHLIARWLLNYVSRIQLLSSTSLAQAGIFGLGSQLGMVSLLVSSSAMNALAPWFYRVAREDGSAKTITRVSTWFLGGFLALTAGICVFAKELLHLLAAEDFASAYPVIIIVAIGTYFLSAYNFPMLGLMYLKKTHIVPMLTVVSALITIGVNALCIPRWGALGAAYGTLIGQTVLFLLTFIVSQRIYPVTYEYGKLARIAGIFGTLSLIGYFLPALPQLVSVSIKCLLFASVPLWFVVFGVAQWHEMRVVGLKTYRTVRSFGRSSQGR